MRLDFAAWISCRGPNRVSEPEFVGKINIQQALNSGRWEMTYGLDERAVWGKHAQPTTLELNLLGRRYMVMLDEEVSTDDPESGRLYVEACDPAEDDLDAINEGLQRIVDEADRELKVSAVGVNWRFGLLWVQGSGNSRELQAQATVDYQTSLSPEVPDLSVQIALDVYNSVSIQDLERNGWLTAEETEV